jgi:cell wall-associated NlpC family hydrolase
MKTAPTPAEEQPNWAANYIGIPYRNRGRSPSGLDCWGLVALILGDVFNIEVPSLTADYDVEDIKGVGALMADAAKSWVLVLPGSELAGDVVLLRRGRWPTHCGVVTKPGTMLHVENGVDAALERYTELVWKNRIVGFYRHLELAKRRPATK